MSTFISVDGPAFTGKSSLVVNSLVNVLNRAGFNTITSHEPGGSSQGVAIRSYISQRAREGASQEELATLFNEARRLHLDEVIIPFLGQYKEQAGICVVDRFAASTIVFQGLEGGVPIDKLLELEEETVGDQYPDLYLILGFPEDKFKKTLEARKQLLVSSERHAPTTWHEADLEVQLQRQRYFSTLPEIYASKGLQRNCAYIDSSQYPTIVMQDTLAAISPHLSPTESEGRSPEELLDLLQGTFNAYYAEGNLRAIEERWFQEQKMIGEGAARHANEIK